MAPLPPGTNPIKGLILVSGKNLELTEREGLKGSACSLVPRSEVGGQPHLPKATRYTCRDESFHAAHYQRGIVHPMMKASA